ncbi:MAG: formyltransferase family protein [Hyphomicrobiaceae bacterium]
MTTKRQSPLTAFFITEPNLMSLRTVESWLAGGNRISALWTKSHSLLRRKKRWRPIGRLLGYRDLHAICLEADLPVYVYENPKSVVSEMARTIDRLQPDVLVTVITGLIIPSSILSRFGPRAINCHPSLLPHYKGPVPTCGMLVDGRANDCGGVTFHVLEGSVDTGPIIGQRHLPRDAYSNNLVWEGARAEAAADIMRDEVCRYLAGSHAATPQPPGSGCYRRPIPDEFTVTPTKSFDDVISLLQTCDGLGLTCSPLVLGQEGEHFPIKAVRRDHGVASGESARLHQRSITMDLDDKRVTLSRWSTMDTWWAIRQQITGMRMYRMHNMRT